MGFRISAVLSKADPGTLLAELGLSVLEEVVEMPDQDHWCAKINASGWTLAYFNDFEFIETVQDPAIKLSLDYATFGMRVHETVMTAQVSRYANGKIEWGVDWIGEQGPVPSNLTTFGQVPDSFTAVRNQALEAQAADTSVDYLFNVPLTLLEQETGFRHDLWLEHEDVDQFRIVQPAEPKSPGLLSRLFGGRS